MKNKTAFILFRFYFCLLFFCFTANQVLGKDLFSKQDTSKLEKILSQFDSTHALKDTLAKAKSYEYLGQICYEDYPDYSIRFLDSAQLYYGFAQKTTQQALCLQNMAFGFDENQGNLDKGLEYANKALALWQNIGSPQNEANILKYIGLIHGKKKQYDSAFMNIQKAVVLFSAHKNSSGVAVCYFNMATVYKEKTDLDSSLVYLLKAKEIWQPLNQTSRIFLLNNALLDIYTQSKAQNKAEMIIAENDNLYASDTDKGIYWKDIDAFFKLCLTYYTTSQKVELYNSYKVKQAKFLESIKSSRN